MKKFAKKYWLLIGVAIFLVCGFGAGFVSGYSETEKYSLEYYLGMLVGMASGIAFVALFAWILKKKFHMNMNRYDERQKLAQGEAYKIGFYALMILMLVHAFAREFFGIMLFDSITGELLLILVGLAVWIAVCLKKEAYFSLDGKPKTFVLIYLGIGVLNLVIGIVNLIHDNEPLIVNGRFADDSMNLIVGIFVLVIAALAGLFSLLQKWEEEEE